MNLRKLAFVLFAFQNKAHLHLLAKIMLEYVKKLPGDKKIQQLGMLIAVVEQGLWACSIFSASVVLVRQYIQSLKKQLLRCSPK